MKTRWKLVLIVAVLGYSLWALLPSMRYYSMSEDQRNKLTNEQRTKYVESAIKLGLDLQGGAHLVMEIDDSNLDENNKKDAVDRVIKILRNRIDQFGVAEPVIQKQGQKRIIIELPGLSDLERAEKLIGQTAKLEFRLVREQDEIGRVLTMLDKTLKGVTVSGTQVDTTKVTTAAPENTAADDKTNPKVAANTKPTTADSLLPELKTEQPADETNMPMPAASPDKPFTSYLVSYVEGGVVVDQRQVPIVTALLKTEQAQRAIPSNSEFLWADRTVPMDNVQGRVLYLCEKTATIDGSALINAQTRNDPDDPSRLNVAFTLNRAGAIKFGRFTGENIGRRIRHRAGQPGALRAGGSEQDSQRRRPHHRHEGRRGGQRSLHRAARRRSAREGDDGGAALHRSHAGPRLDRCRQACHHGGLRPRGRIHDLVLPALGRAGLHRARVQHDHHHGRDGNAARDAHHAGIAGLVLTIGMSVDANVLIFERIREELAKGKTVRAAIQAGFDKAFATILDSHVTTLITAFVLWQFGTGPIKGFATTLSVGLIANMFTALTCTRVVYDIITSRRHVERLSI
jgi:preprotein translocase subunit SecD